jgi:predicted RND superfamily exporter protein
MNRQQSTGLSLREAIVVAGSSRFRPILLTSLTTFAGLTPLLLERSMQAQFLIPMATSLAFGVVFATLVTLLLLPATILIMEDCRTLLSRRRATRLRPVLTGLGRAGADLAAEESDPAQARVGGGGGGGH